MKMRSNIIYVALAFLMLSCQSNQEVVTPDPWSAMDDVLSQISAPTFPEANVSVLDFGAIVDDEKDDLDAFTAAIQQSHKDGGGRVTVPAGTYHVNGPINFEDNINLHLEEGAVVLFSTDPQDYLPSVLTRWEGVDLYNYSPLIYAYGKKNIALTGKGTLDGQASNDNWWPWCGKDTYGWKEGMPRQHDEASRPTLFKMNELETPVTERTFGTGTYLRPNFFQPYKSTNILVKDVTFRNSPMWVMHPVLSENITIENVKVYSHGPNSDGCDPECCKNVLIKNCYFDTGDDCIALKSGRNQDGRRLATPIENVVVQGCTMKDGHGGVVIGSEVSGGARNIFAENCKMDSPNLDRAIRVKTNKIRGGTIENLFVRNIEVGEVKEAVVKVNMHYTISSNPDQFYVPNVKNLYIENVTSKKSKYGILIEGYDEKNTVKNVQISNCKFNGVADGNSITHASKLNLENVFINDKKVANPADSH